MTKNKCCFVDENRKTRWCENPCNWEIVDDDNPDPYENYVHSCDEHLSEMLYKHSTVDYIGEPKP